jgi:hypothetical protein
VEWNPDDAGVRFGQAVALLLAGDGSGYRRAWAVALQCLDRVDTSFAAYSTARVLALKPATGVEPPRP